MGREMLTVLAERGFGKEDVIVAASPKSVGKEIEFAGRKLTVRSVEHDGRLRKYYRITDAGRRRIEEFKDEWQQITAIYQFVTREDTQNE